MYCSIDLPPGECDQDYLPQFEECKEKPKVAKKQEIMFVCNNVCVLYSLLCVACTAV